MLSPESLALIDKAVALVHNSVWLWLLAVAAGSLLIHA